MDLHVTEKQEMPQPYGDETLIVANVIDIFPVLKENEDGTEYLAGAEELDIDREILEQSVSLATIWQKGLDPLAEEEGNRWAEVLREEVNVLELMGDIENSVKSVSNSCTVTFDTVEDANGIPYLSYKLGVVL
jgi:hypothetical protein